MCIFKLKEHIGLENYSWKDCLINYKIDEDVMVSEDNIAVVCDNKEFPCQVSCGDAGQKNISFIADLMPSEEKEYILQTAQHDYSNVAMVENDDVFLKNEHLNISIRNNDVLFEISGFNTNFRGIAKISETVKNKRVEIIENGPVFAKTKIDVEFVNGDDYSIILKLVQNQEFVEVTELIGTDCSEMVIEWQGFNPSKRYLGQSRGTEYATEYLKENSEVPTLLVPYDLSNRTVSSPYITFFDSDFSVGTFIGDSEKWYDGSYAIQSNNDINAVRFGFSGNEKLVWKYPLNKGRRSTCITIYDSEEKYNLEIGSHIQELQFWNYYLPLDLYKDWIFEYSDEFESYPVLFNSEWFEKTKEYSICGYDKSGMPGAKEVLKLIFDLDVIKKPWLFGPVYSRVFEDILILIDLKAADMERADFIHCRNIYIFFAYFAMNENRFPTRHMLAGHANFLADHVSVIGNASALFSKHPSAVEWKNYYERAVLLNAKYHTRPDVDEWKAKGGRNTENLGCYVWAALRHTLIPCAMIKRVYGENPVLNKYHKMLAEWLLNSLSSPVDGKRVFPPMGSHAGGHLLNPFYPPFLMRVFGAMLKNYAPMVAEQILNVCPAEPVVPFENQNGIENIVKLADVHNTGIKPDLKSQKYTGFGFVMRSGVNTQNEMCVFLQQLDKGPNYRWGICGEGGSGNIYYYANDKRYSDNRKEDFGDDIIRDGEVGCTFTVLKKNVTKSIGMNELTYPLSNFEFCQYARIIAGEYSNDEYKYRGVLMVDSDYIVIYDAVRDKTTHGRFSWFSNVSDEMPVIHQVKPGAPERKVQPPLTTVDGREYNHRGWGQNVPFTTQGVMYDGNGDFLTIVTHKPDVKVLKRPFGAIVEKEGVKDYLFNTSHKMYSVENGIEFNGEVGFVRIYNDTKFEAAIFEGDRIKVNGIELTIQKETEHFSVSLTAENGIYRGKCVGTGKISIKGIAETNFYIDGVKQKRSENIFDLSDNCWELTNSNPTPKPIRCLNYVESADGVNLRWNDCNCEEYAVLVDGKRYISKKSELNLDLQKGKYIVNVYGKNGEVECKLSADFPMYINKTVPYQVEGLKVESKPDFADITWGTQLGIKEYRLYFKNKSGDVQLVYSGDKTSFKDCVLRQNGTYFVTAVNGYGESSMSAGYEACSGGRSYWDPMPETEFVRDTIRNEHGYAGFDYQANEIRTILKYPD